MKCSMSGGIMRIILVDCCFKYSYNSECCFCRYILIIYSSACPEEEPSHRDFYCLLSNKWRQALVVNAQSVEFFDVLYNNVMHATQQATISCISCSANIYCKASKYLIYVLYFLVFKDVTTINLAFNLNHFSFQFFL